CIPRSGAIPDASCRLPRLLLYGEQLGLSLNWLKRRDEAERVLLKVIEERGPSSEMYGILGSDRQGPVGRRQAGWSDAFRPRGCSRRPSKPIFWGFEADSPDAHL